MPHDPMCTIERLPLVMPPWRAFWRKPEERWQVRTEAGILGSMTNETAPDVLDMGVDGQYGLGRLA